MVRRSGGTWRYIVIGGGFIAVVILYISLFINLQVSGQDYYSMTSQLAYRTRTVKIQAQRGEIYDRNGKKLVGNSYSYDLRLDYGSMPTKSAKKNETLMTLLSCIESCGEEEALCDIKYSPLILTAHESGVLFEYNDDFFETSRASRYNKLAAELGIKEDDAADSAGEVFLNRYALIDSDGNSVYSPEETVRLFMYRMDLDLFDFSGVNPYTLAEDISLDLITLIRETLSRGYTVFCDCDRVYNYPGYASHILGRIGKIPQESVEKYTELGYALDAIVGTSGVEEAFEEYLHGVDGEMTVTEDYYGNIIETEITKAPTAGYDVYLTIDIELQMAAENSLAYNIDYVHAAASGELTGEDAKAGAVTAVDPKTGEVLALASYPTYDLSTFDEDYAFLRTDETSPMLNRALNGTYQPGSTFKPGVALAALDSGNVTPYELINDTGVYDYYAGESGTGYSPRCWIYLMYGMTHGNINITEAIQESCNYFFYEMGRRLTIENIDLYMKHFGLGESTGIELPEKTGILAGPDYRNDNGLEPWSPGDTLQAAIGQSDHLFTPLQISMYVSALTNSGTRYAAHILSKVCRYGSDEAIYSKDPEVLDSVELSSDACSVVLNAMKDVIENGSASDIFEDYPITIGGKTGTAQVSKTKSDNAIFTAFAPFDDPSIVATCVIEQGNTGSNAGVTVKGIFDSYFSVENDDGETENEE